MINILRQQINKNDETLEIPIGISISGYTFYLDEYKYPDFPNNIDFKKAKILTIKVDQLQEVVEKLMPKKESLIKDRKRLDPYEHN